MCMQTSVKGLLHNFKDWNFKYCNNFKLMQQDQIAGLQIFKYLKDKTLYSKLENWNFDTQWTFLIPEDQYDNIMTAIDLCLQDQVA